MPCVFDTKKPMKQFESNPSTATFNNDSFLIRVISWTPSSEFVSSSIPSWHFNCAWGARDLAFCRKVPLDSLLVWASSEGSGETERMRRLAWTFAARIGDKYQIRLTRPSWYIYGDKSLNFINIWKPILNLNFVSHSIHLQIYKNWINKNKNKFNPFYFSGLVISIAKSLLYFKRMITDICNF